MGFVRKNLSADGLHRIVRHCLYKEKFPTCVQSNISWHDCIMSGLAVFGLKFPSLLKFDEEKHKNKTVRHNLRRLYHVEKAPSDTCLRERLDVLSLAHFRQPFKKIFACLQRGKMLERYQYLGKYYLISIDGTGQYSSNKVHCKNCCEKNHRNGEITYYHHMLGAAIVHPDEKVVIPLAPEPITKKDGKQKNDCERNAAKRLLKDFRREHPHLKALIIEDALAANQPHLELLESLNMKYVIGVKQGDHGFLFDWVKQAAAEEIIINKDKVKYTFRYVNDVPLNDAHFDFRVNVLECWEEKANGKRQYFSWITNFAITTDNVFELMRAGRARWRIENETFNTLKNQGYNFNHNYGHGNNNLCSVMTMLMLLAFLIDQAQELCCKLYKKVREQMGSLSTLFERVRSLFHFLLWENWEDCHNMMLYCAVNGPPPNWHGINF